MTLQDIYTDILNLANLNGVDVTTIGTTDFGNPIYAVHIGSYSSNQEIVEASTHAREYITSLLLIDMVRYLYDKISNFGIYFVPIVNPDGVRLVLQGVEGLPQEKQQFLLNINGGSTDFSQWKANGNAVDINVNFDALWGQGSQNVTYESPANFIGYEPNSEAEVKAMINFTNEVNPVVTLSYHAKGEIIYYGFETLTDEQIARDYEIAKQISLVNGYEVVKTENSTGGYSDWVSKNLQVPAFTIEVGSDSLNHPLGLDQLPVIYEQNKDVPVVAYNATMQYA